MAFGKRRNHFLQQFVAWKNFFVLGPSGLLLFNLRISSTLTDLFRRWAATPTVEPSFEANDDTDIGPHPPHLRPIVCSQYSSFQRTFFSFDEFTCACSQRRRRRRRCWYRRRRDASVRCTTPIIFTTLPVV